MREYFKRLKSHPGVPFALIINISGIIPFLIFNDRINEEFITRSVIFGIFPWLLILLTNRK
jgi:hypothetical protein